MIQIVCAKCNNVIPPANFAENHSYRCQKCNKEHYTILYPAIFKSAEKGHSPEKIVIDDHATCFFHDKKVANVACDKCGVFLCTLCDLEVDNNHYCPKCFKSNKEKIATIQNRTFLYDDVMLGLAIIPILIFYLTIFTAPIVIIASIYFWNKVKTPYPRSKWRFILAITIASLQIIGWATLIAFMVIR